MGDLIQPGTPEAALVERLDSGRMPRHVAVIMDGNGRWAKQRGLDRVEGHRRGAETARLIVELGARLSIPFMTLYTFSSENWKRPPREVNALMEMLRENLELEADLLKRHNIRLRVIGEFRRLPGRLARKLREVEEMSRDLTGMTVNLALNYGGRQEILRALRAMIAAGSAPGDVTDELLRRHLYTGSDPDPDLVIRTSGEKRLSNFLIYQAAYAEMVFPSQLWPDFRVGPFLETLIEFQSRERRFGGL